MATADDTEHWKTFGRWLKSQRLATRRSRKDLAAEAGISDSSWQNYESGGRTVGGGNSWIVQRPSPESLLGIARALGMPPKDVFAKAKVKPTFPLPDEIERPLMSIVPTPDVSEKIAALQADVSELSELLKQILPAFNEMREELETMKEPAKPARSRRP